MSRSDRRADRSRMYPSAADGSRFANLLKRWGSDGTDPSVGSFYTLAAKPLATRPPGRAASGDGSLSIHPIYPIYPKRQKSKGKSSDGSSDRSVAPDVSSLTWAPLGGGWVAYPIVALKKQKGPFRTYSGLAARLSNDPLFGRIRRRAIAVGTSRKSRTRNPGLRLETPSLSRPIRMKGATQ